MFKMRRTKVTRIINELDMEILKDWEENNKIISKSISQLRIANMIKSAKSCMEIPKFTTEIDLRKCKLKRIW